MKNSFRLRIEELIETQDLPGLLRQAGELHGHFCNYLAYGVIAGLYGVRRLGVSNTGMEELLAIVETNNCFADGIQMTTGCTFGNNALIYRDYGKTAVTFSRRNGKAVRLALNPDFDNSRGREYPEAYGLFDKLVAKKEAGTPEEFGRMMHLFSEMSLRELGVPPERMFLIKESEIEMPQYAPVLESVQCERCRENVMKTKAAENEGRWYCIPCARGKYGEVNGGGIVIRV